MISNNEEIINERLWFLKREGSGYEIPDEEEDHKIGEEIHTLYSERQKLRRKSATN